MTAPEADTAYSRPLEAVVELGEYVPDIHRFLDKGVLLTGEPDTLATRNGSDCLLDSLRLLVKICRNVTVMLPSGGPTLAREARALAWRMAFGTPVEFVDDSRGFEGFDAILSIGSSARSDLPWTVANSNGWLARVSSGGGDIPSDCGLSNPMGALAAASLGVADVFKRLIELKPERGRLLNEVSFSLFSYMSQEDPGPVLPSSLPVDLLLVGVGAIGNGIVHLLSQLPLSGSVRMVDPQKFERENLSTCLLIGPADLGSSKAEFAAGVLSRFNAHPYATDIGTFSRQLQAKGGWPTVVLDGLDDIPPRHEVQDLWPDIVIDGAMGSFQCQVSRHPWEGEVACLRCLFVQPPGEPAEQFDSRLTGLSIERVQRPDDPVTEADVRRAPDERRPWLSTRVGKPICSVIEEAIAQSISELAGKTGFQPAVPFVATMSAAMVVGEFVKTTAKLPSVLAPRFQMDVLRGPQFGLLVPQERRRDCLCVTRRSNIEKYRSARATPTG